MKQLSLSQLNEAKKITLYHWVFGMYTINKETKTIIEQRNEETTDITQNCKMENDRFIPENMQDVPYTFGVVCWKILNGMADKDCRSFLEIFDSVTLN